MKNTFDKARAAENTSREAIEYLERASGLSAMSTAKFDGDMSFSSAFMLFTRLSLLITRRRPEIAVHCVLIHVMPHISEVKVSDISRVLVNQLVNPLILEGKIVQGRRVFSLMKQFLSWCAFQGLIDTSPLNDMSLNRVAGGAKPVPRERKLTPRSGYSGTSGITSMCAKAQSGRPGSVLSLPDAPMKCSEPERMSSTFNVMYGIKVRVTNRPDSTRCR